MHFVMRRAFDHALGRLGSGVDFRPASLDQRVEIDGKNHRGAGPSQNLLVVVFQVHALSNHPEMPLELLRHTTPDA